MLNIYDYIVHQLALNKFGEKSHLIISNQLVSLVLFNSIQFSSVQFNSIQLVDDKQKKRKIEG